MAQPMVAEEKSLGDLFSKLAGDTTTLIRQEVALAQTELTQKATKAGKNVGSLLIGGAVAYGGVLAIMAGVILLLARFMPAWASALLVGVVIAIIAFFLISSAIKQLRNIDPVPRQTIETLKEDAKWLKKEVT